MKTYKDISFEEIESKYIKTLKSGRDVARELGFSYKTFTRAMRFHGVKARGRVSLNSKLRDKEWLIDQYFNQQKSLKTIADEIGSTVGAVHSSIRWLGRETRTIKQSLRTKYPEGRFGKEASNWKGGTRKSGKGYVQTFQPSHPHSDKSGYVMEHRLVMEKKIGRYLLPEEVVHHKNGVHDDNQESNLELMASRKEHAREHFDACAEVDRLLKIIASCDTCSKLI